MILINDEVLIENETQLNAFIQLLDDECYNEETEKAKEIMTDFFLDIWDRIKKVEILVHKRISENIFPVAIVEIKDTADFNKIEVKALSKDNDFVPKEKDNVVFNGIVDRYFSGIKTLGKRFEEV